MLPPEILLSVFRLKLNLFAGASLQYGHHITDGAFGDFEHRTLVFANVIGERDRYIVLPFLREKGNGADGECYAYTPAGLLPVLDRADLRIRNQCFPFLGGELRGGSVP